MPHTCAQLDEDPTICPPCEEPVETNEAANMASASSYSYSSAPPPPPTPPPPLHPRLAPGVVPTLARASVAPRGGQVDSPTRAHPFGEVTSPSATRARGPRLAPAGAGGDSPSRHYFTAWGHFLRGPLSYFRALSRVVHQVWCTFSLYESFPNTLDHDTRSLVASASKNRAPSHVLAVMYQVAVKELCQRL